MKILYVGDVNRGNRCWQRYRWLLQMDLDVTAVESVPLDGRPSRTPSILDRIFAKLGYPRDTMGLNRELPRVADRLHPDVLWIDKTDEIWPSTYRALATVHPRMRRIYFSEDDIFLPHNRSVFLTHALPTFDIVFTTKPRNVTELPTLGARRVECLYQAFDPLLHRPLQLTDTERRQWGADVSFVGTYEAERARSLEALAKAGFHVRVFGSDWRRHASPHPNLKLEPPVTGEQMTKIFNASKVNLNFLRRVNRDRHTSRSVEIPACGAFMLAERSNEHAALFAESHEAEFFADDEELVAKVRRYLDDPEARQRIAMAGRRRCLTSGYAHPDRLGEMVRLIQGLPG